MISSTRLLVCALVLFINAANGKDEGGRMKDENGAARSGSSFEIRDGDRVLLMGDTLIEREGDYGYLETRMHEQFPAAHFIVRNLGFSADTPLGASRASFDPVAKGVDKIREQLELVKPTVAILGYGMAASLEEMTYRSGDPALNADVARYGTEHGVAKFKNDLSQLMDIIEQSADDKVTGRQGDKVNVTPSPGHPVTPSSPPRVRFVLLSPIRHEDLRAIRPGLPDPAEHNKLLEQYSKAIEELAKERGARFVSLSFPLLHKLTSEQVKMLEQTSHQKVQDTFLQTDNGIHLNNAGYMEMTSKVCEACGWGDYFNKAGTKTKVNSGNTFPGPGPSKEVVEQGLKDLDMRTALRAAVLKKNALFFNRWRPANETYLLGFRKHEQGQNAKEIPMFDPLVEAADAEIDRIKYGKRLPESGNRKEKQSAVIRPTKKQIEEAQKLLAELGFTGVEATGRLDSATRAALRQQQRAAGLKATGTLNASTLEKLGIALTPKQAARIADKMAGLTEEQDGLLRSLADASGPSAGTSGPSAGASGSSAGTSGSSAGASGSSAGASGSSAGASGSSAGASGSSTGASGSSAGTSGSSAGVERSSKNTGSSQKDALLASKQANPAPADAVTPLPLPTFTLDTNLEISVFAENPLLEKPTQMNWDARGRLWVASSSMYPMIAPGEVADDKVLVLEDTKHSGVADKSTVFADGLLLPTGVVPDLGSGRVGVPPAASGVSPDAPTKRAGSKPKSASADVRSVPQDAEHGGQDAHPTRDACYVGASTQLLHFSNPDPKTGKATSRRIVLSGFGTEDTHHILHTLHWGPDGRLYFHQSIYIHSHIETPWGVVRANAGTVFAYDPRTERLEVFCKGLWNSWGQQEDRWGQTFLTDGAGSTGVSWAFPGEVWSPSEGSRKQAPQISPGGYPKFAGLELIDSPAFPDDWQGNAITCDFRAHRIVRFGINDLSNPQIAQKDADLKKGDAASGASEKNLRQSAQSADKTSAVSGYATVEKPDVLRTSDVAFRPIDVRHGPDGALYVADWSNPVINHGEVDFRDPRRDHHHGRIWRITYKGRPVVKWESLVEKSANELYEEGKRNAWVHEQGRRVMIERGLAGNHQSIETPKQTFASVIYDNHIYVENLRIGLADGSIEERVHPIYEKSPSPSLFRDSLMMFAAGFRESDIREFNARYFNQVSDALKNFKPKTLAEVDRKKQALEVPMDIFAKLLKDESPRVRLEALRALARIPTARSAELVLDAAVPPESLAKTQGRKEDGRDSKNPGGLAALREQSDPWLDFAAWQSINDLAKPWSDAVLSGAWKADGREAQLEYALNAIDPAYSGPVIAALLKDRPIPRDGAGPWIELIGKGGSPAELRKLFTAATTPDALDAKTRQRALVALLDAARTRSMKPDGDLAAIGSLFDDKTRDIQAMGSRLSGAWHLTDFVPRIVALASLDKDAGLRGAGFEGLRDMGGQPTVDALKKLVAPEQPLAVRRGALVTLARHNLAAALAEAPDVFSKITNDGEALETWRGLLKEGNAIDALEKNFPKDLPPVALAAALKAAREKGHQGALLAKAIEALGGKTTTPKNMAAEIAGMAASVAQGADPAEGEMLYRRIGCVQCHSIGGAGGKLGPDLTSIGASAPMDYLVESVLDPAAKVKEGYHAFAFTMKDGSQMTGIPTRETNTEQFIRPGPGPEVAIVKANIVKRENIGSLMPPGLIDSLQFVDKRSLFAFLGQLGRPGPFDASKGNVARVWWLYGAADFSKATKAEKLDEAVPTYSLVDGKLVRELLKVNADLVAKNGGDIYAVARFEAPGATKSPLTLTGAKEAWLDGKPFAASAEIATGAHILAVKLDAKNLPEFLKAQCDGARFLGE